MSAYKNTFWACKDHTNFISTSCAICDEQRIAKLEAQLAEANERAEKAAQDGWLKTAETQLARAKKAEAKLAEFQKLVDETKEGELAFTPEDLQAILEKE